MIKRTISPTSKRYWRGKERIKGARKVSWGEVDIFPTKEQRHTLHKLQYPNWLIATIDYLEAVQLIDIGLAARSRIDDGEDEQDIEQSSIEDSSREFACMVTRDLNEKPNTNIDSDSALPKCGIEQRITKDVSAKS